jgi:hypothetical protein
MKSIVGVFILAFLTVILVLFVDGRAVLQIRAHASGLVVARNANVDSNELELSRTLSRTTPPVEKKEVGVVKLATDGKRALNKTVATRQLQTNAATTTLLQTTAVVDPVVKMKQCWGDVKFSLESQKKTKIPKVVHYIGKSRRPAFESSWKNAGLHVVFHSDDEKEMGLFMKQVVCFIHIDSLIFLIFFSSSFSIFLFFSRRFFQVLLISKRFVK